MRLLLLEADDAIGAGLRADLEPLGHGLTIVPAVDCAQVALLAECFDAAILSARLLDRAAYSLVDYIRITRPALRVLLVRDTLSAPDAHGPVDWVLTPPASSLEIVQVMEYLMDHGASDGPDRSGSFTYAGARAPGGTRRNWLN